MRFGHALVRTLGTLVAVLSLTILSSCGSRGPEPPDPAWLVLARGEATMHLLGTVHKIPIDKHEAVAQLEPSFGEQIGSSDVVFLEYPPTRIASIEQEYRRIANGDDARPSVRQMVAAWSEERRAAFVDDLAAFPLMDHAGRQETFLDLRPWAALSYLQTMMYRNARIDSHTGIDDWVMDQADRRGTEIRGLHTSAEAALCYDAADQVRLLETLENDLARRPDAVRLAEASVERLSLTYDSWATGRFGHMDNDPVDALFRPIPGTPLVQTCPDYEAARGELRERVWVATIDRYLDEPGHSSAALFVAVGAAHIDPDGYTFVRLLLQDGWEIDSTSHQHIDRASYQPADDLDA